jgi:hypothetical protein
MRQKDEAEFSSGRETTLCCEAPLKVYMVVNFKAHEIN